MARATKKSNVRLNPQSEAGELDAGQRRTILDGTAIPTAYKIGYILNFYREPSFRAIEMEFGLTRPEIVILIFLTVRDGASAMPGSSPRSSACVRSRHWPTGSSPSSMFMIRTRCRRRTE